MVQKKKTGSENRTGTPPHRREWTRGVAIAALILAGLLVGLGGGWFLAQQGTAAPGGNEPPQAVASPSPRATRVPTPQLKMVAASRLPGKVMAAPPIVQDAYRFAAANPETLSQVPCFCNCGSMGHKSNLDCFVHQFKPDGSIVFDDHALG